MKKSLLTIISSLVLLLSAFAQKGQEWVTQVPQDCFCCNDKIYNLPVKPPITGSNILSCDSATKFTTLNCPGATITWSVSPSVPFTGQGTSTITITGPYYYSSYTITVQIKCGNKVVTNQVIVKPGGCQANPAFSMSSNGSSATFSSIITNCTHYWYLVKDNDGSCSYTSGDTYVGPITTATANFSSLINSQQYTVYHFVYCKCGKYCSSWAWQVMCFKWLPAQQMKIANGAKGVEKLKELEIRDFKEIPQEFKKDLPKELLKVVDNIKEN